MPSMLRAEEFEALLRQLGPDRDWAGVRYEQLRQRLLMVFTYRGCSNVEHLADETMDRVAHRLAEHPADFDGSDPTKFILGVAWNVAHESFRRRHAVALPRIGIPSTRKTRPRMMGARNGRSASSAASAGCR